MSLSAQNWTKEMQKDFRKSKDIAVVVDLTHATIMGVPYADFPDYYSGKFQTNARYPSILIDKFKKTFINTFYQTLFLNSSDPNKAKYVVHYVFKEITDKGGFHGTCWVECNKNNSISYYFDQKDGRWNDFEKLLMENTATYFRIARNNKTIIGGNLYEN